MIRLAWRMLSEPDKRALWKFVYNFGLKGLISVQKYKSRLKRGEHFPPFLFISVINSCQLRCQGCWVDVASPRQMISRTDMKRVVDEAKGHGNSYFGIIGGEPFLHPDLIGILGDHRDAYFQVFTNGHLIDDEMARKLRRVGNATPLISIEGDTLVSDVRRGRAGVYEKSIAGVRASVKAGLITGVATSVCKSNIDAIVCDEWLHTLIEMGVHYVWFHTYRVIGPDPSPELALSPEEVVRVRRFIVERRSKLPIAIVEPYWDHEGKAMCPMTTGVSHHIGPNGDIEPCPIIQFATGSIHDGSLYDAFAKSDFLADMRKTAAGATRGCIVLEDPQLMAEVIERNGARDTTQRGSAMAELRQLEQRRSQHVPGQEVPEEHWAYRFAKRFWYHDFGAYSQSVEK